MKKAIIIIQDEVNCKIQGLEAQDRRTLMRKFEFEVPGARFLPSVKMGRWNGKTSFFSLAGSTYVNLLEDIITYLYDQNYDIELVDKRIVREKIEFKKVTANSFSHVFWPENHPLAGKPVILRDYQVNLINNFLENTQSIQEAATGAGKTIVTAALSSCVEPFGRSLVIVPNKSLVTQTEADYINMGLDVGVYFGERKEVGKTHTICTWQSINSLLKRPNKGEDIEKYQNTIEQFFENIICVIADECFDGDEKVLTTSGYIPIKNIKPGDKIVNYCTINKEFREDIVVKQHINLTNSFSEKMYKLVFNNGVTIKVTGNHKFFTNLGWYRADELDEQHQVIGYHNSNLSLVERIEIEKPDKVYNLHIKNEHNYIVNGVVVSNCHQAKANILKQLLTEHLANVPIRWGLTGTVPKDLMDQVSLLVSLGPVISKLPASELQDKGVLAKCEVNILQLKDNREFANYQNELKFLLEDESRIDTIAEIIKDISVTGNTLVLIDRVNPGKKLVSKLPGAVFISGETTLTERKEEYDEVAVQNNKILVATYGVAAVGINIPRIFNLVLIEPGKSFVRVIQSIGRGIRKAEDKDFVNIYDITSTCRFSKRHLTQRKQYYKEANYPFTVKKIDY
jgi:superfamily II DNA or RNA helicase